MRNWRQALPGQTLVIVALLSGVLIGLVALGVDGGSALLQRRNMQNGADAGALAGIQVMENNVVVRCSPSPCHPTYPDLSNLQIYTRTDQLVVSNRGGTLGDAAYPPTLVEYHYMAGAVDSNGNGVCLTPSQPCYQPMPANDSAVPSWVDGIRVTAGITNPTTFARAINIQSIPVGAQAAARINPTCSPASTTGDALPFIDWRPDFEQQLQGAANDPTHLYEFWQPHQPLGGQGNSWKNMVSLRQLSMHENAPQLLTRADTRHGPGQLYPGPATCGGVNPPCVNMAAPSNPPNLTTDVDNWLYWGWNGTISATTTHQVGITTTLAGDWVETYSPGNHGNNVSGPIRAAIAAFGQHTVIGDQNGWGLMLQRVVWMWGMSSVDYGSIGPDPDHAQAYDGATSSWTNVAITGMNYHVNTLPDRVRISKFYTFRFYQNLQGSSSSAKGMLVNTEVPGPDPSGSCGGWQIGGGVYGRGVDPNGP